MIEIVNHTSIREEFYDRQNLISVRVISGCNLIAVECLRSHCKIPPSVQLKSQQNATLRINVAAVYGDRGVAERGKGAMRVQMPASGEYRGSRYQPCVISVLASRRQTSAITQPRDPANMSAYVRLCCARTA